VECGGDLFVLYGDAGYDINADPFTDPVTVQLIGRGTVYLDALFYLLDIDETTPLIDYKVRRGMVRRLSTCASQRPT
jgi:hypothetical protein